MSIYEIRSLPAPAGSASEPSIAFLGDPNTGIYSPGADQVAISTNSSQRLLIDASGNVNIDSNTLYVDATNKRVGLGTSSPDGPLHISSTNSLGVQIHNPTATTGTQARLYLGAQSLLPRQRGVALVGELNADSSHNMQFWVSATSGAGPTEMMRITNTGRLGIGTTSPATPLHTKGTLRIERLDASTQWAEIYHSGSLNYYLAKNNATSTYGSHVFLSGNNSTDVEHARIDSSGRLLVGTASAATSGDSASAKIQIQANTSAATGDALISLQRGQAAASISSDSPLGKILFADNAGNEYGVIQCRTDGNSGSGDYPGRLVFSTTADGASSPTERMRITSDAYVRLASGTGGIQFNGDTAAANALDDYEEGVHTATATCSTSGTVTLDSTNNKLAYTKIGKLVSVHGRVSVSAISSPTGVLTLSLPFVAADLDGSAGRSAGSINIRLVAATYDVGLFSCYLDEGSSSLSIAYGGSTDSVAAAPAITANTQIWISVTYRTTS
jgi:hypothetical protein